MARYVFPRAGDRLVYDPGPGDGSPLRSLAGARIAVYTDAEGTQLANIQTLEASSIAGSIIAVDDDSLIPLFLGPDGVEELWVRPLEGNETSRIEADREAPLYSLEHVQGVASSTWEIDHGLTTTRPVVVVTSADDRVVLPDVHYASDTQVVLDFGAVSMTGRATLFG